MVRSEALTADSAAVREVVEAEEEGEARVETEEGRKDFERVVTAAEETDLVVDVTEEVMEAMGIGNERSLPVVTIARVRVDLVVMAKDTLMMLMKEMARKEENSAGVLMVLGVGVRKEAVESEAVRGEVVEA